MSHTRDRDLPEYSKPPINEVVLGVQFLTPPGYSQIYAGNIWEIFKQKYPNSDIQAPLAPVFEIFGRAHNNNFFQSPLRIGPSANHERYWFISEDKSELLQFQQDRLMHNWREISELKNEYPRFDNMIANFRSELQSLDDFMTKIPSGHPLQINQCEVSYINHLPISGRKADFWIKLFNFNNINPENLTLVLPEVLTDSTGSPFARLTIEAYSGEKTLTGEPIISLNLTVRGAPRDPGIDGSVEFLTNARKIIVTKFTEITTEAAHTVWERQQ